MPSRSPSIPVRTPRRRAGPCALLSLAILALATPLAPAADGAAPPVAEISHHDSTGVLSAWLANGVRLHHRRVERAEDRVHIFVSLYGGVVEEDPGQRGLTKAAAAGIRATRLPSPGDNKDSRPLTLGAAVAGPDMVRITLSVERERLDEGLEILRRALTEPRVDDEVVERWRDERARAADSAGKDARAALGEAIMRALYGPVGAGPLDAEAIAGVRTDDVRRWAAGLLARAPIEAVVVSGDGPEVMERVAQALAALPDRERLVFPALAGPERRPPPDGPMTLELPSPEPEVSAVAQGFLASDLSDLTESRRLILAARVVEARVKAAANNAPPSHVSAHLIPADAYPGLGLLAVTATTPAGSENATADRLLALLGGFAEAGPTEDELEAVRRDIRRSLEASADAPWYWLDRLSQVTARGYGLDALAGANDEYATITAEEIRETFAEYMKTRPAFRVLVRGRVGDESEQDEDPSADEDPDAGGPR